MGTLVTSTDAAGNVPRAQTVVSGQGPSSSRRSLWAKLAVFLAIPIALWFLAFFFVKSQVFRRHFDGDWISASSPVYTARNVNCEVVVYGDSTAITGIDPEVIQKMTQLKSCNIAQSKGALVVLG